MTKSIYRSEQVKTAVRTLYDRKRAALTIPTESVYVDTPYGSTHVLIAGPSGAPPLLLVHGLHAGAAVALEPLQSLAGLFRIYAPDTAGQAGYSSENPLNPFDGSYGRWLHAVREALSIERPRCVSVSFGAYVLLDALLQQPEQLGSAVFIVPSGFVNSGTFTDMAQTFYRLARYKMRPTTANLTRFLQTFASVPDSHMLQLQALLLNGLRVDYRRPPVLSEGSAAHVNNDVYLITAAHDVFFPSQPSIARARSSFRNFKGAVELAGEKHIPGPDRFLEIATHVSTWLNR